MLSDRTYAETAALVGRSLGTSDWLEITQDMVNEFANCTGDRQWIHIDAERARRESPFGGPVAHGYLTLSLLASLSQNIGVAPAGTTAAINYGLNKVRFLAPVLVGARVRLHVNLLGFDPKPGGGYLLSGESSMEIEATDKPALIAETLVMVMPGPDAVLPPKRTSDGITDIIEKEA